MNRPSLPARLLAVGGLLLLAACGGGDGTATPGDGVTLPTSTRTSPSPTTDATSEPATPVPDGAQGLAGVIPGTADQRPPMGSCTDLPESPQGVYSVADAGVAEVRRDGNVLVLGAVQPAPGWTYEVEEADSDEVEIEFRGSGADAGVEVDLEVEIDDGRLTVEICTDDD